MEHPLRQGHAVRGAAALFTLFFLLLLVSPGTIQAQSAQMHNTAGLAFFYQGKYDQAFDEFVKALKVDPSFAAPHFNLGRLYEQQRRYPEALEQYRQCLQLDPSHSMADRAMKRLGFATVEEPAAPSAPASDAPIRLDEQKEEVQRFVARGDLDRAEERLLVLLRGHRDDGELHSLLARVYERRNNLAQSIAELQRARDLMPDSVDVAYRLAANLYRAGNFDEAKRLAEGAARLNPGHYQSQYLLGLIELRRDKPGSAYQYFESAARIKPDHQAIQAHLKRLRPKLSMFNYNAGLFYFQQGNFQQAKTYLDKAIKDGGLLPLQKAVAEQYLLIADFSFQKIRNQISRIDADRRTEQLGFVRKRLGFDEVQRSPSIWERGSYVEFRGQIVSFESRGDGAQIVVDTGIGEDYRIETQMERWFTVKLPKALPEDRRIRAKSIIRVEGMLLKPDYVYNTYNATYSRRPQPTVEGTYIEVSDERELAGPLKVDYLAYSDEQRKLRRR